MDIAVVGTGFIGGTLGRALARAGHNVTFGSRHPEDGEVVGGLGCDLHIDRGGAGGGRRGHPRPSGAAVPELVAEHGAALNSNLVIDATNRMEAAAVGNSRADLPVERPLHAGLQHAGWGEHGGSGLRRPSGRHVLLRTRRRPRDRRSPHCWRRAATDLRRTGSGGADRQPLPSLDRSCHHAAAGASPRVPALGGGEITAPDRAPCGYATAHDGARHGLVAGESHCPL